MKHLVDKNKALSQYAVNAENITQDASPPKKEPCPGLNLKSVDEEIK